MKPRSCRTPFLKGWLAAFSVSDLPKLCPHLPPWPSPVWHCEELRLVSRTGGLCVLSPPSCPLHGPCRLPGAGYGRPCTVLLDARLQGLSRGSVSLRAQPWAGAFLCTYPLLLSLPLSVCNRQRRSSGWGQLGRGPSLPPELRSPTLAVALAQLPFRASPHGSLPCACLAHAFPLLPGNWRPFRSQGRSSGDKGGQVQGL